MALTDEEKRAKAAQESAKADRQRELERRKTLAEARKKLESGLPSPLVKAS